MQFPSIASVAADLRSIKRSTYWAEIEDDWIDVRLRVQETNWTVLDGDPCYDLDHNGYWGAGSLSKDTNCRQLAADLISEARDHYAQCAAD